MELAEQIHRCITGNSNTFQLLDHYGQVKNSDMLTKIYDYIVEKYDYNPHEIMSDIFNVDELYAISSTEKFIRKPSAKNRNNRDRFYLEIGYQVSG